MKRRFGAGLIVASLLSAATVAASTARAAEHSPESWSPYVQLSGALTNGFAPTLFAFDGYL
jgi:hypothetical protein